MIQAFQRFRRKHQPITDKFVLHYVIKLYLHNQQRSAGLDLNHPSPGDRPEEIKDRKSIRDVCESEPEAERAWRKYELTSTPERCCRDGDQLNIDKVPGW